MKAIARIAALVLSILVVPLAAEAQQPAKVPRVGWLSDGIRAGARSHLYEGFPQFWVCPTFYTPGNSAS